VAPVAGYALVLMPTFTIDLVAVAVVVAVIASPHMWTVHAALFVAVTTLPIAVPYGTQISPISAFLHGSFLYIAELYAIRCSSIGTAAQRCVTALAPDGTVRTDHRRRGRYLPGRASRDVPRS
jgi:hypothetical protein